MSNPPRRSIPTSSGIRPPASRIKPPTEAKASAQAGAAETKAPAASLAATTPAQERKSPEVKKEMSPSKILPPTISPSRGSDSDPEKAVLKAQIKDLNEKLETLMMRRKDDREKLLEFEKVRIQLQQLQEYKKQMTEVNTNMAKQLALAKKEAKEALELKNQQAEDVREMEEAAEMATLDKEMAEEKYEQVAKELEATKEKLELVTLDLEIMKQEIDSKGVNDDSGVTTYQVKQLEQQNLKLRDAIIKLRDITSEDKNELARMTKELESIKSSNSELHKSKEKLEAEIRAFEEQVLDLKEQIDSAMGSETMIDNLTEKNFKLEEELTKGIEDREVLEKLLETNELLLEQAKETEQELLQDIDLHRSRLNEVILKLDQSKDVIADHESTIGKFRELVTKLKDEIKDLQDKKDNEMSSNLNVIEHESSNIEFKIRLQTEKVKNLEAELKKQEEMMIQERSQSDKKAEDLKLITNQVDELKNKIAIKDNEIHELKRLIKSKIEEASEHQIRREIAEKKLSTANKDADERVIRMQNDLDNLKNEIRRKEKEFEETMNHLQSDIEQLESEKSKLKDRVKNQISSSSILSSSASSVVDNSRTPLSSRSQSISKSSSSYNNDEQIAALRRCISRLKCENDNLKTRSALKDLNLVTNPSASMNICNSQKPSWLLKVQGLEPEPESSRLQSQRLKSQVDSFMSELRSYIVNQKVIDSSKDIQNQRREDLIKQKLLASKYQEVERKVRTFMAENHQEWKIETHLDSNFVSADFQKIKDQDKILAARIHVPCAEQARQRDNVQLEVTLKQLKTLHQRLL